MKVKITIEEVISQEFEVEVSSIENAYEEIRKMYREDKIEVTDACLQSASVSIKEDGEYGEFMDLHAN